MSSSIDDNELPKANVTRILKHAVRGILADVMDRYQWTIFVNARFVFFLVASKHCVTKGRQTGNQQSIYCLYKLFERYVSHYSNMYRKQWSEPYDPFLARMI